MMFHGGLDQGGSSEDGEKWSDSVHTMNSISKNNRTWGVREASGLTPRLTLVDLNNYNESCR